VIEDVCDVIKLLHILSSSSTICQRYALNSHSASILHNIEIYNLLKQIEVIQKSRSKTKNSRCIVLEFNGGDPWQSELASLLHVLQDTPPINDVNQFSSKELNDQEIRNKLLMNHHQRVMTFAKYKLTCLTTATTFHLLKTEKQINAGCIQAI
jgi:hypothetical protein